MTHPSTPLRFPFAANPCPYQFAPELTELRKRGPVVRAELPDGNPAWLVSGFEEVSQVFMDQRFSRALASRPDRAKRGLEMTVAETIMGMDPPEHTRLRKLAVHAFTTRRVEALRPRIIEIIDELIAGMVAKPRPVDLVSDFALLLPVRVICAMLGVPAEDVGRFSVWSDKVAGDWHHDPDEMMAALAELRDYIVELVRIKRAAPTDDLISGLIAARDEQDRLSERELVMMCVTLLVAGFETTANHINMSLITLASRPEELERLRADLDLIPVAVEELLRFVQLPNGVPLPWIAREDLTLGDITVRAGEIVLPLVHAADRDPREFPEPDRLDLSRRPTHLAFGTGIRRCLGAQLARLELTEALRALLGQLPGLRIAVPVDAIEYKPNMVVNSPRELPITWD